MKERLAQDAVVLCLDFGYMGIISVSFFLFTGAVGFWSCFWFTRLIYGSIKVD